LQESLWRLFLYPDIIENSAKNGGHQMKKRIGAFFMFFVLCGAMPAWASLYQETVDAGSGLTTAAELTSGIDKITGSLNSSTDRVDMFKFYWGGGAFYVNTVGTGFDSKLILFDNHGHGVQANDDGFGASGAPSFLQRPSDVYYYYNGNSVINYAGLDAGTYYLAITGTSYSPYAGTSTSNTMFPGANFTKQNGPRNSTDILTGWTGSSKTGSYTINFTEATKSGSTYTLGTAHPTSAPVPLPPAVLLLGSGLSGLFLFKKRRIVS
jgi:hypothetical protein